MGRKGNQVPNTLYLSLVWIDPGSKQPLFRQIYSGLRQGILDGRLAPRTKLPSTRDLAVIWGVSRNTLRNAFDQLIAEGFLEAIVGRGTFVVAQPILNSGQDSPTTPAVERVRPISRIGEILEPIGRALKQEKPPTKRRSHPPPFAVGVPDVNAFPHKLAKLCGNSSLIGKLPRFIDLFRSANR